MLDSTRTQQPPDRAPAPRPVLLRRISLGMLAGLLIQYGLGMIVNLYVSVPARDHGGGMLTAVGRALANGPAALTVHAALGLPTTSVVPNALRVTAGTEDEVDRFLASLREAVPS